MPGEAGCASWGWDMGPLSAVICNSFVFLITLVVSWLFAVLVFRWRLFFPPLFIVLFQLADRGLSYLSVQLVSRLKNTFAYLSWEQACQVSALCSIT